jgi:hypothetical protein
MAAPTPKADILMDAEDGTVSPAKRPRETEGPSGSTQVRFAPAQLPQGTHTNHTSHNHSTLTYHKETRSKETNLFRAGPPHMTQLSMRAPEPILRSTGESHENTPPQVSAMARPWQSNSSNYQSDSYKALYSAPPAPHHTPQQSQNATHLHHSPHRMRTTAFILTLAIWPTPAVPLQYLIHSLTTKKNLNQFITPALPPAPPDSTPWVPHVQEQGLTKKT